MEAGGPDFDASDGGALVPFGVAEDEVAVFFAVGFGLVEGAVCAEFCTLESCVVSG